MGPILIGSVESCLLKLGSSTEEMVPSRSLALDKNLKNKHVVVIRKLSSVEINYIHLIFQIKLCMISRSRSQDKTNISEKTK